MTTTFIQNKVMKLFTQNPMLIEGTNEAESAWQHLDDGVAVVVTNLNAAKTKGGAT